jgi:Flp pilus assembly protein TadB
LADGLLATEARSLTSLRRAAALNAYSRAFVSETNKVTLASEHTVTLTSRRANIPITVLSSAPYPVDVVISLASDKFTFPNGNSQKLTLDRPTTSVRFLAQARGSGDRLPIDVTLRTPDGQLVIARTVLTVHSTAISFVGVALTVLAGAVLLVWWARTWRRSRRRRPRAAH